MSPKITIEDVRAIQATPGKSVNDFTPEEMESAKAWELKFWAELGEKSPFYRARYGDWRADDETLLPIIIVTGTKEDMKKGEYQNNDTGWTIRVSNRVRGETVQHAKRANPIFVNALGNIDSVIKYAVLLHTATRDAPKSEAQVKRKINAAFMHSLYCIIEDASTGERFLVNLMVDESYDETREDTAKIAYELKGITKTPIAANRFTSLEGVHTQATGGASVKLTISDLFQLVKENDKSFKPITRSR